MFPHILLFFQGESAIIDAIKVVGFPVVVALALLWFAYKVWGYTTTQIEKKDTRLAKQAEEHQEFAIKIAETQNAMVSTQEDMAKSFSDLARSFGDQANVLTQIKEVLQTHVR